FDYESADDIPDEPIPEVFTTSISREKESRFGAGKAIVAVLAVLIAFGGVGYFARDMVLRLVPQAGAIYEMVGLGGEVLGAGLDIRSVKSDREVDQGKDVLVVWGSVVNISDMPRDVPPLKVSLYDADNEEIQFVVVMPAKSNLKPGDNIGFKARLSEPSPLARRVEVTFSEPDKPSGAEPPPEAEKH
ncbi:MAG: DUF3426 domain-containing protein, partial [Rhodospirillales bacterium]|nr:DUF3426 domain-containing protein [Rhodospirillales bacterium]